MWRFMVATAAVAAAADQGKQCPGSPNQCSLHGSCMINRHGEYICNCQWGYTGYDCSQKMCPHGFDPVDSGNQQDKILRVSIMQLPATSSILIQFHGHVVELDAFASAHLTVDVCAQVFRRFRNLGDLSCAAVPLASDTSSSSAPIAEFDLTLKSFPVYPVMNNLFYHEGNPPSTDFSCTPSSACRFTSITDSNVKAYLPCSNHGLCNVVSGLCACEPGYHGANCGSNTDAGNMLDGLATGPFFSGNLLRLSAMRSPSSAFDIIHADAGGAPIFTMDGVGHTTLHGADASLSVPMLVTTQLDVQRGGKVRISHADVKLADSRLVLSTTSSALVLPLVDLDVAATTESVDLISARVAGTTVFQVSSDGRTSVGSELSVGRDVGIGGHLVVAQASRLQGPLVVHDIALVKKHTTLEDGLAVHGPSVLRSPNVGSVEIGSTATHDVLAVTVESGASGSCMACRSADSALLFDVAASGATTIHQGGVRVESGGVHVEAGGQTIASGGLTIRSGGLAVEGGTVTIHDTLSLHQGIAVTSTDPLRSPLRGQASHPHFAGTVLALDAPANATTPFDFVRAGDVWRVRSDGSMWLQGGLTADGPIASATGPLIASHQALFRPRTLQMQPTLTIPCTHSYVHITDDGESTPHATQTIAVDGAAYGQLLIIQNSDPDGLKSLKIPPYSSALFVFDGQAWQTLTATEFDTTRLQHVQELTAAGNLNIGAYQFAAHSIQVGGQPSNRVAVYGKGGVLTSDASLAFDAATSTLHVHQLHVDQVVGKIDMTNSELRGVDIIGGYIRGINMSALLLEVAGDMYVESNAYVGGGLVVDGQVMGSGSYVDSSDARFKTNVTALSAALARVKQLRGVEYNYDRDAFPRKGFSGRREIGFVAQEVDDVLPEVVTTDSDGFKYVAYSRIVPVVVEAVKSQASQVDALESQVAALQAQVDRLEAALATVLASTTST
ncbi:hypothetical protein H310_14167 [Aphanomyces invadans]|uniref:EGF-like domain-containing protein n=1 Tax=Aphanomyces invadans TaxID=157072 RepID=A0A024TC31_9STRA|nr:hypothetical protein H310_14167 [Aphanomyces invadans]ETV91156.1 hypothetical protein H310_14167 [Aphanomyces invadans]|eukprot:XP_008880187.1 hypothetical protein H310_14167 [Aphanomyces invadans]